MAWIAIQTARGLAHVHPEDDLIEHELDPDANCICGPYTEFVPGAPDGSNSWIITHHSLDGRELTE